MQTRLTSPLAALAAVASLTSLAPITAGAAEYTQVTAAQSSIAFSYQQMGVKMDGQFKRFAAQLAFDPAKPASAKATGTKPANSSRFIRFSFYYRKA